MGRLLIMWLEIPEEYKCFGVPDTPENREFLGHCHEKFVNGNENAYVDALSEMLGDPEHAQDWAMELGKIPGSWAQYQIQPPDLPGEGEFAACYISGFYL